MHTVKFRKIISRMDKKAEEKKPEQEKDFGKNLFLCPFCGEIHGFHAGLCRDPDPTDV